MQDVLHAITLIVPDLVKGVITLFIIVDPIGNVPIFIGLTEQMNKAQRMKVFHTAIITGIVLLLAFAIAGHQILIFFGISIHSFMIAGGLLLLIIAVRLLVGAGWRESEVSPESVGVVPIACPLLVGPGAITTTILSLQTVGFAPTVLSVIIIFAIVWAVLRLIEPIYRFLGKTGSLVISRVMAMFIAAIAVEYIFEGLKHAI